MKVGLTIDPLGPLLTGIGRYTWELCRGVQDCSDIEDLDFFRYDQWIAKPESYLSARSFKLRPPRWVRRLTMRSGFHGRLIHGTNYFLPKRTELGVLTVHDMSVYRYPEMHPPERIAAFERGFMTSLDRAAHVITDSHAVRSELIAQTGISPEKVTTVHLGASDQFAPFSIEEREGAVRTLLGKKVADYILCVATFEPRKRIEQAILAHAQLSERVTNVPPLVLVGAKGWLNDDLHALIERQTALGRLISLGQVPEADLPFLYAGARLFLYPSIYEGFGLPPIEAMASGVPVIVSDRSCLPEVTQGAAMMINPDDIDAFAEAIRRGLEDDNWRCEAIDAGIRVAASYTWGKCIENTVDVYRKVWAERA